MLLYLIMFNFISDFEVILYDTSGNKHDNMNESQFI